MNYQEIVDRLALDQVCLGGCGIERSHEAGFEFLGVVHWRERRVTRRGLRNFLLLVARRNREADPGFLNTADLDWAHLYWDHQMVTGWAQKLGIRIPAALSYPDRERCLVSAASHGIKLSARYPSIYEWAYGARRSR